MKRMIGVLGGMGPEATAEFFRRVISLTDADTDQQHVPLLIHNAVNIPDRTESILANDGKLLPALIEAMRFIDRREIEAIVIPCVSAHVHIDELRGVTDKPVLSLLEETAAAVDSLVGSTSRVGVLGTNLTVSRGLFREPLEARGHEVVHCFADIQQQHVMGSISAIKAGDKTSAADQLAPAIEHLRARDCQALIAGCTELPLVMNEFSGNDSLPVIDTLDVLARATVRFASS